jgi:hypothetical protein
MLVNLRALLVRLIDIVLLRGGPEQLPASSGLLAVVVALNVVVSALVNSLIPNAIDDWQTKLLVETAVGVLVLRAAFSLAKKPERFLQTATALFGTATLFMPALIPMSATLLPYIEKPDPAVPPPAALSLLAAVLGVWLLVVQVRILRAAFEWHWLAALLFFFALNIASALAYGMLFGFPSNTV